MQIAMQQEMFAAARARSLTSMDGAAAMAAVHQIELQRVQEQSEGVVLE
jgi:hypothetical protein